MPPRKKSTPASGEQTTVPTPPADLVEGDQPEVDNTENTDVTDDTDVEGALGRETDDGPGEGDVPDSDFVSYEAGENVTAYKEDTA